MGGLFDNTLGGRLLKNKKKSGIEKGKKRAEAGFAKERAGFNRTIAGLQSERANLLNAEKEEERSSLL